MNCVDVLVQVGVASAAVMVLVSENGWKMVLKSREWPKQSVLGVEVELRSASMVPTEAFAKRPHWAWRLAVCSRRRRRRRRP